MDLNGFPFSQISLHSYLIFSPGIRWTLPIIWMPTGRGANAHVYRSEAPVKTEIPAWIKHLWRLPPQKTVWIFIQVHLNLPIIEFHSSPRQITWWTASQRDAWLQTQHKLGGGCHRCAAVLGTWWNWRGEASVLRRGDPWGKLGEADLRPVHRRRVRHSWRRPPARPRQEEVSGKEWSFFHWSPSQRPAQTDRINWQIDEIKRLASL